jgi:hypothetical protein
MGAYRGHATIYGIAKRTLIMFFPFFLIFALCALRPDRFSFSPLYLCGSYSFRIRFKNDSNRQLSKTTFQHLKNLPVNPKTALRALFAPFQRPFPRSPNIRFDLFFFRNKSMASSLHPASDILLIDPLYPLHPCSFLYVGIQNRLLHSHRARSHTGYQRVQGIFSPGG